MDWQQKAAALNALSEISIKMRSPGDWYVYQQVMIKDGPFLFLCGKYGNGSTPQEAIEDHWRVLVEECMFPKYLIASDTGGMRRSVLWNGFMWVQVNESVDIDQ